MMRVVRVADALTIVVERDHVQTEIHLAGIEITDAPHAVDFLRWTLASSWVMVENGLVYRSPDAMFVNAELVRRGFARPYGEQTLGGTTVPVTYLGTLDLGVRETAGAKQPAPRAKAAKPSTTRRRARSRSAPAPVR